MNEMSPRSDPPGTDTTPAQIVSPPASPSKSKPKVKFVEPTYKSTLIYALSYLCVEGAIVVSCSAFFQNVATPPWRLEHDAPWHSTLTRLSVWMNICHGLSHLVNGTFYREFKQPKFKLAWAICWTVSCIAQCTVTVLPRRLMPLVAKISVVGVANLATVAVHMWPYIEAGRSFALKAVRLHIEDKLLWAMHGAVLLGFSGCRACGELAVGVQLLNMLWPQAVMQFMAWLDALHCAPFHMWGLVQQSNYASHILSVHMAWKARTLGNGHAIVCLYFFYALSSALYEPRATLPNFAADKTMKIWYASPSCISFARTASEHLLL